jgi:hypothetical protein
MAERLYRIVLDEPYSQSKDGRLRIRYGETSALVENASDENGIVNCKNHEDTPFKTPRTIKPGVAVYFPPADTPALTAGDPDLNHVDNVPEEAVILWFGDPRYPDAAVEGDARMHKGQEGMRVAEKWGGFKIVERRVGKNWAAFKVGPPNVPHVSIFRMNERGGVWLNKETGLPWVFRPWEHFGWNTETWDRDPELLTQNAAITSNDQVIALQKQMADVLVQLAARDAVVKEQKRRGRPKKELVAVTEMP